MANVDAPPPPSSPRCFVCYDDALDAPLRTDACGCRDRAVHDVCLMRARAACASHAHRCPVCLQTYATIERVEPPRGRWGCDRRPRVRSDWRWDLVGLLATAYAAVGTWLCIRGNLSGWEGLVLGLSLWFLAASVGVLLMWLHVISHRMRAGGICNVWCCLTCTATEPRESPWLHPGDRHVRV